MGVRFTPRKHYEGLIEKSLHDFRNAAITGYIPLFSVTLTGECH